MNSSSRYLTGQTNTVCMISRAIGAMGIIEVARVCDVNSLALYRNLLSGRFQCCISGPVVLPCYLLFGQGSEREDAVSPVTVERVRACWLWSVWAIPVGVEHLVRCKHVLG